MATIEQFKNKANSVANATQVGENTAQRVGGALQDAADIISRLSANIDNISNHAYEGSFLKVADFATGVNASLSGAARLAAVASKCKAWLNGISFTGDKWGKTSGRCKLAFDGANFECYNFELSIADNVGLQVVVGAVDYSTLYATIVPNNGILNMLYRRRTSAGWGEWMDHRASGILQGPGEATDKTVSQKAFTALLTEYDVSAANGGRAYTLTDAIAAVPAELRKSGLTIKFVDVDKKEYVTRHCVSPAWSAKEESWKPFQNETLEDKVSDLTTRYIDKGSVEKTNFRADISTNQYFGFEVGKRYKITITPLTKAFIYDVVVNLCEIELDYNSNRIEIQTVPKGTFEPFTFEYTPTEGNNYQYFWLKGKAFLVIGTTVRISVTEMASIKGNDVLTSSDVTDDIDNGGDAPVKASAVKALKENMNSSKTIDVLQDVGDSKEATISQAALSKKFALIEEAIKNKPDVAGDVSNNADEEDITSVLNENGTQVLKFKDKAYNKDAYSGLARKYLRKNIKSVPKYIREEMTFERNGYIYNNKAVGEVVDLTKVSKNDGKKCAYCIIDVKQGDRIFVNAFMTRFRSVPTDLVTTWSFLDTENKVVSKSNSKFGYEEQGMLVAPKNGKLVICNDCTYLPMPVAIKVIEDGTFNGNIFDTELVSEPNTMYIVQYDYSMAGNIVDLPENSVLVFEGGSIVDGFLNGKSTEIASPVTKIFGLDTYFVGKWFVEGFYPEWFGATGDAVTDDTLYLQKVFDTINSLRPQMITKCYLFRNYLITRGLIVYGDTHILGRSCQTWTGANSYTIYTKFDDTEQWAISSANFAGYSIDDRVGGEQCKVNQMVSGYADNGVYRQQRNIIIEHISILGNTVNKIIDGQNLTVEVFGGIRVMNSENSHYKEVTVNGFWIGLMRNCVWYASDYDVWASGKLAGYFMAADCNNCSVTNGYLFGKKNIKALEFKAHEALSGQADDGCAFMSNYGRGVLTNLICEHAQYAMYFKHGDFVILHPWLEDNTTVIRAFDSGKIIVLGMYVYGGNKVSIDKSVRYYTEDRFTSPSYNELPTPTADGMIAYNSTTGVPVYSKGGVWYDFQNNAVG